MRLFMSNNHVTVAGLIFPMTPCRGIGLCARNNGTRFGGLGIRGLNLWSHGVIYFKWGVVGTTIYGHGL